MKKDDCIFCKIAAGEIPSKTIYEDEAFRVILDLGPATRGHALILPKNHADNLYELPEEDASGGKEGCCADEEELKLPRSESGAEQRRGSRTDGNALPYAFDSPV